MVTHIVLWNFMDGVDKEATYDSLKKGFAAFTGQVPGLRSFNLYRGYQGWDICLLSTHDDRAALETYQQFPAHLEMKQVVKSTRKERASCDFDC